MHQTESKIRTPESTGLFIPFARCLKVVPTCILISHDRSHKKKGGASRRRRSALIDQRHVPCREDEPDGEQEEHDQPDEEPAEEWDQAEYGGEYQDDDVKDNSGNPEDDEGNDVAPPADLADVLEDGTEGKRLAHAVRVCEPNNPDRRDQGDNDSDDEQEQEADAHRPKGEHEIPVNGGHECGTMKMIVMTNIGMP